MMKRDKLYTVTRFNRPMFKPNENLFDDGEWTWNPNYDPRQYAAPIAGAIVAPPTTPSIKPINIQSVIPKQNWFSGLSGKFGAGTMGGSLLNAGAGIVGSAVKGLISDGYNTGAGNAIASLGTTAGSVIGNFNPVVGAVVTGVTNTIGGLTNRAFGTKTDQEALNNAKAGINYFNNFTSNASSFDDIRGPQAMANFKNPYKGGWFKSVSGKNDALRQQYNDARLFADRSVENNVNNLIEDQLNDALANYSAFGGPIDTMVATNNDGMGAIEYEFMSDYLNNKRQQAEQKNQMTNMFAGMPNSMFGEGGGIHIKPENRGKFTKLKERTGHSATWFKEHGTPAQKKMATFALNAKHWKHGDGGLLDTVFTEYPVEQSTSSEILTSIMLNKLTSPFKYTRINTSPDFIAYPNNNEEYSWRKYVYENPRQVTKEERAKVLDYKRRLEKKKDVEKKTMPFDALKYTRINTSTPLFAFGGDMQTNYSDFGTGLTHVDAGGSHEENPYDGVQMGVDPQGTPNLVEEGEVVWNDYVFSNRIKCDTTAKEKFHLPKKREMTYADLAKKLEKEITERPNDPISKAGFNTQMAQLEEQQERQKQEMEAERAKAAFEALSPEEQAAVMQQVAAQVQQAEQPISDEIATMEQQGVGMTSQPIEEGMMEQQVMAQQPTGQMMQENMGACGGKMNKYDKGGVLKFLKGLGYKTVADAEKAGWKPSDFGKYTSWNDISNDAILPEDFQWTDEFSKRLTAPEAKAALSLGWNPLATPLGRRWYEGDEGNDVGWTQSNSIKALNAQQLKEYAKRYKNTVGWALENGVLQLPTGNNTIPMSEITRAMREAPDWKATDEWLYSDPANMASYLGMARGLNPDDDTKFINRWSPYGTFTKNDDGTWNYALNNNLTEQQRQAFVDQFRRSRTDDKIGVMYNNFHDPKTNVRRYALDENGQPTLLLDDDLSGYTQVGGPYTWGSPDEDANNTALFYQKAGTANGAAGTTRAAEISGNGKGNAEEAGLSDYAPKHKWEGLRYAGLFGPAVGLGMQALGVGKPDYSNLDAVVDRSGRAHLATYKPLGNYLTYRPMDIWFEQNRMDANARATDRAIQNNATPATTKMAGLLANGYNSQIANGELYKKALEYNDAKRAQVAEFNRGTNQFNADAFNRLSQFNASALNDAESRRTNARLHAAQQRLANDAGWYNSLYGNINGLFKGISDIGRENAQHNMIADMAANGIFGTLTPDSYIAKTYLKKKSKGGKLKRKGLTF